MIAYGREYNIKNREKISSYKKEYYLKNREKILSSGRIYQMENPRNATEKSRAKARLYYRENIKKYREYMRIYGLKNRAELNRRQREKSGATLREAIRADWTARGVWPCALCKSELPLSEFRVKASNRNGHLPRCIPCTSKNPEATKAKRALKERGLFKCRKCDNIKQLEERRSSSTGYLCKCCARKIDLAKSGGLKSERRTISFKEEVKRTGATPCNKCGEKKRVSEFHRSWWGTQMSNCKICANKQNRLMTASLSDSYIKSKIRGTGTLLGKQIPNEIVELKRAQIILLRELRKTKPTNQK